MRDIIFRGKRLDNGEWEYGDLLQYDDGSVCIGVHSKNYTDDGFNSGQYRRIALVDEDTVGQYTGMKDKNGKKIFERDILAFVGAENPKAFFVIVEWDARLCCYYLRRVDVNICNRYGFFPSSYTLEGNIHDHKHLIK